MSITIIPHMRSQSTWTRRTNHVADFPLETFQFNRTLN
jgi:hypothetical protein